MQFDFQTIINNLNNEITARGNFAFAIARARVIPSDYLFNTILPQENRPGYNVNGGSIRIYPTMAGLMPMDTPPPPIGAMETSTFFEKTGKYGGTMHFPEKTLRDLQEWANALAGTLASTGQAGNIMTAVNERLVDRMLNFAEVLLKSQWDRYEWLRGEALTEGLLNWNYNGMDLDVNYDVPTAHIKSYTGVDSFYNTSSKYWTFKRFAESKLRNMTQVMNNNTYQSIIDNPANNTAVVVNEGNVREILYWDSSKVNQRVDVDARDRARIIIYDKSGTLIDVDGNLIPKAFCKDGRIVCVGEQTPDGFELLEGSTDDPTRAWELGYTHLAPTVEGGMSGFWQRIFTPEGKPYQVIGETVSNGLPVIINPNRLVIGKTAMP